MVKQKILCILLVFILICGISISSFASNTGTLNNQIQNNQSQQNQNEQTQDNTNQDNNNQQTSNDPLENLNQQKEETQEKLEEANSQLEYVQTEMSNTLVQIQELDDKIRQYEQENTDLLSKLQELETSITETTEKLETVTQEYEKKSKQLEDRLVALYEAGDIAYLDVLLSANSLSDFLSLYYAMIEIAEYDNQLIDKVEQQKDEIDLAKRKLENETAEVKILKAKAEQTEVVLKNTKTLQQGYIEKLSEDEKKLNEEIQQYKDDTARIEAKILEIANQNQEFNIQYTGGTMIWPVAISGTGITSYYGSREHPIAGVVRFHQGIDIGNTGFGAPVVAVADGVVTYAGWLGSYGNCVMVYHGDGITTLYGHGQQVLTQNGAEVKQGDVIMQTGSTGNSTGPHLHFEIRINGSTTNPLNYVKEP